MRVLAIDSALDQCAAAVFDTELQAVISARTVPMQRGHAEALMPLIEEVAGGALSSLSRIAVTVGPGSFTGLRIGIAAARGLALALGVPAIGVTTFAAFAAPYLAFEPRRPVAVILDAKNDQVYLQEFGADGVPVAQPAAMAISDAPKALGPGPMVITGTAAEWLSLPAKAAGKQVAYAPSGPGPDIAMVARLGAVADADEAPPRPLYIRSVSTSQSRQPGLLGV